jgi:hypothetical protein
LLLLGFDLKPSNSFEKSNQAKTHEHVKWDCLTTEIVHNDI